MAFRHHCIWSLQYYIWPPLHVTTIIFHHHYILPPLHFTTLTFHHHYISPPLHFTTITFHLHYISPPLNFTTITFYHHYISPPLHFTTITFHHHYISPPLHFTTITFHHPYISPPLHFTTITFRHVTAFCVVLPIDICRVFFRLRITPSPLVKVLCRMGGGGKDILTGPFIKKRKKCVQYPLGKDHLGHYRCHWLHKSTHSTGQGETLQV
jgi:hypothetical protein